jgi:hypothetical protein
MSADWAESRGIIFNGLPSGPAGKIDFLFFRERKSLSALRRGTTVGFLTLAPARVLRPPFYSVFWKMLPMDL